MRNAILLFLYSVVCAQAQTKPSGWMTDFTAAKAEAKKTGKPIDAIIDSRLNTIPARRFGTAEEFGAACAFLCSAHAGYITGQNVLTDGGAYPGTY